MVVCCRARPLNQKEISEGSECCLKFETDGKGVSLVPRNQTTYYQKNDSRDLNFNFDKVYGPESTQKEVYDYAARPIVDSVLQGFNGTVFAYGQTSSGKTHTMQGYKMDDIEHQGIVPRMIRTVFSQIEAASDTMKYVVTVSMAEIYNEKINDLLNKDNKDDLKIKETKEKVVFIADLTEISAGDKEEVLYLMKKGSKNRVTATTNMNDTSSRSH